MSWCHPQLSELADRQCGVLRRGQIRDLVADPYALIDANVSAERWTLVGDRIVLMQNAPPDRQQVWWIGVLHAGTSRGEGAALAGMSALEAHGLAGFECEETHVVVERGRLVPPLRGLVVHESRRFDPATDVHPARLPPRTRTARSGVDAGAWQRQPRRSAALLAAMVQQRMATTEQLMKELSKAGRVRHRKLMAFMLQDIAGGAHSLAELDVGKVCRRAGLCPPDRQRYRTDAHGRRRYLDCEWMLNDGRIIVLEVDGAQHISVQAWWRDLKRERGVVLSGRIVLRCGSIELRLDPDGIARDLKSIGVPSLLRRAA